MMKLGEAANRVVPARRPGAGRRGVGTRCREPQLHHPSHDEINRELTWLTLSSDLPAWKVSLQALFDEAELALGAAD